MKKQELPRELEEALHAGDIAEAKRLFSQCEPDAIRISSNVFSLSPMPREFAFWAREQGADVNFRNYYGQTPIFSIVRMDGDVGLLIELGADPNARRDDGWTPIRCSMRR